MNRLMWLIARVLFLLSYGFIFSRRAPDQIIGKHVDGVYRPYLLRWFVFGKNKQGKPRRPSGYTFYLHCFVQDDGDRAKHDHPWDWWSLILDGRYTDHRDEPADSLGDVQMNGAASAAAKVHRRYYDSPIEVQRRYLPGCVNRGKAEDAHRVSLDTPLPSPLLPFANAWVLDYLDSVLPPNVTDAILHNCEARVPCWTLFVMDRWKRDWGFHTPDGWVPWREFVDN